MKKIIFLCIIILNNLIAYETSNILPYIAKIKYDNQGSIKDEATVTGLYHSVGNSNYLLEFDYGYTNIKYKDSNISNLVQDDIIIKYAEYYKENMIRGGIHYINTSDTGLGDGIVLLGQYEQYKFKGYDRDTFGLEGYYTYYKDGYDDKNISKTIDIIQFSPYYSFKKVINILTTNTITGKLNYIIANDYSTSKYTSFELSDTFTYEKFYTTVKFYTGEMKSGVKDGGNIVYNSKDLLKNGYSLKVGYNIKYNLSVSAKYLINNYKEDGQSIDTSNSISVLTLFYSF